VYFDRSQLRSSQAANVKAKKRLKLSRLISQLFKKQPLRALHVTLSQSQSINKVPTRFDVYIKGNRNDIFATRGADIAILTGFGEHLFTKAHGFISNN
jgi:hypothetical protein